MAITGLFNEAGFNSLGFNTGETGVVITGLFNEAGFNSLVFNTGGELVVPPVIRGGGTLYFPPDEKALLAAQLYNEDEEIMTIIKAFLRIK